MMSCVITNLPLLLRIRRVECPEVGLCGTLNQWVTVPVSAQPSSEGSC
jgi:hypothetical protein